MEKKRSSTEYLNYRLFQLVFRTIKIFERILDNRIREIGEVTVNQVSLVNNCGSRLRMEKHHEKHHPLCITFLDLKKSIDRVPHELIWYILRQDLMPEGLG